MEKATVFLQSDGSALIDLFEQPCLLWFGSVEAAMQYIRDNETEVVETRTILQ